MRNKSEMILKEKNIFKTIFILALPIMFCNALKSIHDMVDMFFIKQMSIEGLLDGADILSAQRLAISFTGPIFQIFQALAMGFMIAGLALMSQYIGAKKLDKAKKVSGQLLILCIVIGIICNIVLYFMAGTIMNWMGAEIGSYKYIYSVQYLRIRSFEMTGLFIFFAYQATRQAEGDMITPVIINVISVIVNIILTATFIIVLKMDIKGAAWATVIGNMIIVPICIFLLSRKRENSINLEIVNMKPNYHYIKKIFMLGSPAALSQAFTSLGFVIINSLIIGFSYNITNGISIGSKIHSILLFPAMAFATVLSTLVGQNVGAKNIPRARKCFKDTIIITEIVTIIGVIVLMFLRRPMAVAFLGNDEASIKVCIEYLFYLLMGLPIFGLFQVFIGLFQGTGRTNLSLIASSIRLWGLRLPMIWIFINLANLQEASVWYAMILSNTGGCILCFLLYRFVDYKPHISSSKKRLNEIVLSDENNDNVIVKEG